MLVGDGGGGGGVPPGDPGALQGAAQALAGVAAAVGDTAGKVTAEVSGLLGPATWSSPGAQAFQGAGARFSADLDTLDNALRSAAAIVRTYAQQLADAQAKARRALAAEASAQAAADQANAHLAAQAAPPASAGAAAQAAFASGQAQASTAIQDTLSTAMGAAQALQAAAFMEAAQAAAAAAAGLSGLTSQVAPLATLPPTPGSHGAARGSAAEAKSNLELANKWLEWAGHRVDFAGAGAVALEHAYEKLVGSGEGSGETSLVGKQMVAALEAAQKEGTDSALFLQLSDQAIANQETAMSIGALAESPLSKLLLASPFPAEGSLGFLSKVPGVGLLFTAGAIGLGVAQHKPLVEAVGAPMGNLAVGTVAAEGLASLMPEAIAGMAIPGVGEVILVGAGAVAITYGVDKGVTYLWDHRQAIEHGVATAANWAYNNLPVLGPLTLDQGVHLASGAFHEGEHLASDAAHLASDAMPWNW